MNNYFIRSLTTCSIMLLLTFSTVRAENVKSGPITYQEIGDLYLSSFGAVENPKPQKIVQDPKNKKLDLSLPVLSDYEKKQLLFGIMSRNEKIVNSNPLIDEALRVTLKDLDVYYGGGKDKSQTLMSHLGKTIITQIGAVELPYMLAHPLSPGAVSNRQALIKELIENEALAQEVELLLQNVKKAESGFLSYFREHDPVSQQLFKDLYFSKPGLRNLNNNSAALEGLIRLGNIGTFLSFTGDYLAMVGLNYYLHKKGYFRFEEETIVQSFIGATKGMAKLFNPKGYWQQYKDIGSPEWEAAMLFANRNLSRADLPKLAKGSRIGTAIVPAALTAYLAYKAYTFKGYYAQAKQAKDSVNYLHTRLIDVAAVVQGAQDISILAQGNMALAHGLLNFNNLEELFFGSSRTAEFVKLIDLLQTNTFKGDASFFSLSGRVLAAHKLMTNEKEQFADVLKTIGELDACLSMAKLYKQFQNERVGYCFVEFVTLPKPDMSLLDFWNPFVDIGNVVTNSLKLGASTDASKIILTGSNTGGKSTLLKAIMTSLLLAHTFGVAPAAACTLTPFEFLGSYLKPNDDTASGESKFKAEVLRAKMLCQTMESLPKDRFGFMVIDELLTGTGSHKGAPAAAKIALKLAGLDNNLYILATHFASLTELENDNVGLIKNYKVDVYKDDAGNLVRPFKLEVGVSTSNVANEILNEQISDIDFSI